MRRLWWRTLFLVLGFLVVPATAGCAKLPQLGDPIDGLTPGERAQFERGRALFLREFTPEDGLGPLFNAASCGECHEGPVAGGVGDEVERHIARLRPDGTCDPLIENGGPVIQEHATPALEAALRITGEPVPEDLVPAHRTTPDLFGFGLLDAVPESRILEHADPEDRDHDGISGRASRTADGRIGRFGRKAQVATLRPFNDDALLFEMGITSERAPREESAGGQPIPAGVDPAADPEIDAESLRDLDAFVRFLAPPAPRPLDREGKRGRRLFTTIGCAACHVPVLRTGPDPIDALDHRRVGAYSDLLLHDMGADRADICLGDASASEFRTEPLMGLRLEKHYLHDGRAGSIDEAIRLHAGEATGARMRFLDLDDRDRRAMLAFLDCL
jgi:CxxC motif-containing protein (DUF1111 family)